MVLFSSLVNHGLKIIMKNSRNKQLINFKLHAILSSLMWNLFLFHSSHLGSINWHLLLTASHGHHNGWMIQGYLKQIVLFLTHCQWQSNAMSQCLHHWPHFISWRRHFTISHHHTKGEYSSIRYFESKIERIYTTFMIVYCYNFSIIIVLCYYT